MRSWNLLKHDIAKELYLQRRLSTHRKQKSHKFPDRVQKSEAAKQIKTVSIASPNLYSLRKHPFLLALRR